MTITDFRSNTFQNISNTESASRVLSGTFAIVAAITSNIVATFFFAPILVLGMVLILTGIIGWDPLRALMPYKSRGQRIFDYHQNINRNNS